MNKKFILFISGIVITITGLVLGLSNYIDEKINIAYDTMNSKISTIEPEQEQKQEETEEQEEVEDLEHYIGYLEIPKINFNRGFYSKNSEFNNVELNIQVLSNSSYPDTKNSNLILAAHSGDAYNSYFTDLKYLSIDDELIITYKDHKYHYLIKDIYDVEKTGTVNIKRDQNQNTLTLITCTSGNLKYSQTVYIAYLSTKE